MREKLLNKECVCIQCGKNYLSSTRLSKHCSDKCRKDRFNERFGRHMKRNSIVSGSTVGAISEIVVCADLLEKGFSVFRSLSPSCFCDVIAVKDNKLHKIEVRTAYKNPISGNLTFPTKLSKSGNNKVSCYALYERNENKIYYLSLDKKEYTFD